MPTLRLACLTTLLLFALAACAPVTPAPASTPLPAPTEAATEPAAAGTTEPVTPAINACEVLGKLDITGLTSVFMQVASPVGSDVLESDDAVTSICTYGEADGERSLTLSITQPRPGDAPGVSAGQAAAEYLVNLQALNRSARTVKGFDGEAFFVEESHTLTVFLDGGYAYSVSLVGMDEALDVARAVLEAVLSEII